MHRKAYAKMCKINFFIPEIEEFAVWMFERRGEESVPRLNQAEHSDGLLTGHVIPILSPDWRLWLAGNIFSILRISNTAFPLLSAGRA